MLVWRPPVTLCVSSAPTVVVTFFPTLVVWFDATVFD
jgi:hypothetical protein